MAIKTLEDLFAANAHRTVESLIRGGDIFFVDILQSLRQRFGQELTASINTIQEFVGQVSRAVRIADELARGQAIDIAGIPPRPYLPSSVQYTVLAEIEDVNANGGLGQTIRTPFTINSDKILTIEQLIEEAIKQLLEVMPNRETVPAAQQADMIRADERMRTLIEDVFGGRFIGDIIPLTVYRRGE